MDISLFVQSSTVGSWACESVNKHKPRYNSHHGWLGLMHAGWDILGKFIIFLQLRERARCDPCNLETSKKFPLIYKSVLCTYWQHTYLKPKTQTHPIQNLTREWSKQKRKKNSKAQKVQKQSCKMTFYLCLVLGWNRPPSSLDQIDERVLLTWSIKRRYLLFNNIK